MEFGTEKRIVTIVARGLYVLKSFGDAWRAKLKEMLKSLGKKIPKKDTDVWTMWYFNPNGDPYYKYMLCYVDDLLHIVFKKQIHGRFKLYLPIKGGLWPT